MKTLRLPYLLLALLAALCCQARHRQWTVADGLPTGEVQQLVSLPNGQMLVNCEGVFCIANGARFDVVPCDYGRTHRLSRYTSHYGQLWQGDSLLWLHDFYRVYLYDTRRRAFRYDLYGRLGEPALQHFGTDGHTPPQPTPAQQQAIDSLHLAAACTSAATDWQGGLWIGTRSAGIYYLPPRPMMARQLPAGHTLVGQARSTADAGGRLWHCKATGLECDETDGTTTLYNINNVKGLPHNRTTFIQQLGDDRYLLCDSLSTLGYFSPAQRTFTSLSARLPALSAYRHFVGACQLNGQWTVVYTQNGLFMLDTRADTLAPFPVAAEVERYATKYNCMVKDREGRLWIGTQNGLFSVQAAMLDSRSRVTRIDGLANNCIRSLVTDRKGRVWAGTACGITRITPTVVNLGPEDGVPAVPMMERAACSDADGRLVFAFSGSQAVAFHPDSLPTNNVLPRVVITAVRANGQLAGTDDIRLQHQENSLRLQFSTLDYAAPSHTLYRSRLLPVEQQWNIASGGGQATAVYAALPPGDYTFEAQAANAESQWGSIVRVNISIRPPWWLTWWAKTLYVLIATAVAAQLLNVYAKRRRQKMERDNDERVNRMFELRDEARHQFAQAVSIDPRKITADKDEELLVERMLGAIARNMDNLDYTVDQLARDVAMSRATLYKKTQLILGLTPNDFLRSVRLKEAARLLSDTQQPVSQVSLMVGFQTARYFSQCFKQMFGMTPTEYRNSTQPAADDDAN